MFPLKIGDIIYVDAFQVANEHGIWKYYSDSEDESDDDWEELF